MNQLIIDNAKENAPLFENILKHSAPFEIKGVLNSEMLLLNSLINYFDIEHVIESGRARGQSTELIARWLKMSNLNAVFDSIEFDKNSPDVKVAETRVKNSQFPVNLHYGDSFVLIDEILNKNDKNKIILIDGPKGIDAVSLAVKCLNNSNVKAVCIHDVHKDDKKVRELIENNWLNIFASDDTKFVKEFEYLDTECWKEHQKYDEFKEWGPYKRGKRKMKSYGPTLICLFRNNSDEKLHEFSVTVAQEKSLLDKKRKLLKIFSAFVPKTVRRLPILRKIVNTVVS